MYFFDQFILSKFVQMFSIVVDWVKGHPQFFGPLPTADIEFVR